MKNIKKIIYFFTLLFFVSSCSLSERVTLPQYVTVEKINSLQNGMSKTEVANKMNVAPFDAYHALQSGCELYSYKYVLNDQKIRPIDKDKRPGLKGNQAHYTQPKDVYVYFKNNRLVDIITDLGLSYGTELHDFSNTLESSCIGPVSGCTDAEALNYNKNATKDNGRCEYCPCDQIRNPNYDPIRKCGDICIPIVDQSADASSNDGTGNSDNDCSICDIVKNAGANTTINVSTVAPWVESNTSSNTSKGSANTKIAKKLASIDKKIAKINKSLAKSKANDLKKGKVSKKTQVLQKSLDKLTKSKDIIKNKTR
jgi:hypothetical protein